MLACLPKCYFTTGTVVRISNPHFSLFVFPGDHGDMITVIFHSIYRDLAVLLASNVSTLRFTVLPNVAR